MTEYSRYEITVRSSVDGSEEPSLFFPAEGSSPRPLLVGLHTWSFNRFNQINNMLPYARQHNFHLLLPEFRGSNTPGNERCRQACGSPIAVRDILDAIEAVKGLAPVDESSILLLGASGGGHMALMTAATAPRLFRAVGSFVPITDLAAWYKENSNYAGSVLACCETEEEMARRSPIHLAEALAGVRLKIFHGKSDPVVPYTHSVNMFLKIMETDPGAGVYLDIFDGGHEMRMPMAMDWLLSQMSKKETNSVTG